MGGYRDLEIWQLARELGIKVHEMTLHSLPKFEMYEEGSQIRRSAKSVRHNIVEGYGRRRYKMEFLKHLTYALGSCDETSDTLQGLWDTGSLSDESKYHALLELTDHLGRKLHNFIQSVERNHNSAT
jgi:four helix bundle protein